MNEATDTSDNKNRLFFSEENFEDYWTALIAKVRRDDECDSLFSGSLLHPLPAFQARNAAAIAAYNVALVPVNLLGSNPLQPTEEFIQLIKLAHSVLNPPPDPVLPGWDAFLAAFLVYKRV